MGSSEIQKLSAIFEAIGNAIALKQKEMKQ